MAQSLAFHTTPMRTSCLFRPSTMRPMQARRVLAPIRCSANSQEQSSFLQKAALPAAALLGAALLFAATPDEALAARSGGRVGGSGFSSRPRSAPMPRGGGGGGGGVVRNYNYYSAPPLVSPYGYGVPFFGGGMGVGVFPVFGIGSIFNIIVLMFILNIVFQVISGFTNGGDRGSRRGDDDSDDERW